MNDEKEPGSADARQTPEADHGLATTSAEDVTIDAVLDAWFADEVTGRRDEPQVKRWFAGGKALDTRLRNQFGQAIDAAARGDLDDWRSSADGTLALVIMLDQFSRNIYRGTAQAFAYDKRALAIASAGIDDGHDAQLPLIQRVFLYLPFEHDETPESQQRSLALFGALVDDSPSDMREMVKQTLDAAEEHAAIVARFGRYPHRNAVLGRESTPEEVEWLASDAKRFGQ